MDQQDVFLVDAEKVQQLIIHVSHVKMVNFQQMMDLVKLVLQIQYHQLVHVLVHLVALVISLIVVIDHLVSLVLLEHFLQMIIQHVKIVLLVKYQQQMVQHLVILVAVEDNH